MQNPDSPADGASRWPRPDEAHALYVITLVSSPAPPRIDRLGASELAGLAMFRSRLVEDGRERFRLHVGYFPSAAAAERLLPTVRRTHPAAFVALAPYADMGSLDDTAMARFSILQAPVASTAAPRRPVALQGPKPALLARRRGEAAAPTATVANGPAPPVRAPPVLAPPVLAPAARVPASTATPPARESAPTRAAAPEPAQSAPVAQLDTTQPPQVEAVAQAEALQKFAVQLMWTRAPIDVAQITRLKIFNGYLLYAVETEPGGSREYGVRLGFYGDALSAGLVAQYVRPAFKDAAVVPVSERELKRAAAAVIRVAPAHTRGTRARWPAAAVSLASVRAR